MHGLFKSGARIAAAGALGVAALAASTSAAQAQGWHSGWRNHSGATVVVRCDWRGEHCRRIVVYDNGRYGYGYRHHYAYRYHYGYGYGPYHHRPHRW